MHICRSQVRQETPAHHGAEAGCLLLTEALSQDQQPAHRQSLDFQLAQRIKVLRLRATKLFVS